MYAIGIIFTMMIVKNSGTDADDDAARDADADADVSAQADRKQVMRASESFI